jgi:hypothetical protein
VRDPPAAFAHPRSGPHPAAPWIPWCQEELGEQACNKDELLWLRTLERYGSTCKHWAAARSGVDIPEAPTFYPTAEEFDDPGWWVASVPLSGSLDPPYSPQPQRQPSTQPQKILRTLDDAAHSGSLLSLSPALATIQRKTTTTGRT